MRNLTLAALALFLGGCVSLLPDSGEMAPRIRLQADAPVSPAQESLPANLVIADPVAEAVYNTFNVAVATGPYRYEYLAAAEWADRVPILFRLYLERRFENAGAFTAVGDRSEMPIGGGYILHTDIRAFHLDQTRGAERALVSFGARLTDSRGRTIGKQVFAAEADTQISGRRDFAQAFNDAAQISTEEVVRWASDLAAEDLATREED